MFAKLYETEVGQILAMHFEGDSGPEVRFYFMPEGLGVCSVALEFEDSDEGWDNSEKAFEKVDEAYALSAIMPVIGRFERAALDGLTGEEGTRLVKREEAK